MADILEQLVDTSGDLIREKLPSFLSKAVVATIILLVGLIIGNLLGKLTKKVLREFELNKIIKSATDMKVDVEGFLTGAISYLVYFLAIIMALNQLGLTTIVLYLVAGAIIIIVAISWLLAIKDFLPNILAGIYIARSKFIKVGDKIKFKNIKGKIDSITLLETRMKNKDGDIISIPNSKLTKEEIIKLKR